MLDALISEGYVDLVTGKQLAIADAYEANVRVAHRYDRERKARERR